MLVWCYFVPALDDGASSPVLKKARSQPKPEVTGPSPGKSTHKMSGKELVDNCQPISFLFTKVTGIENHYNNSRAIDIKGTIEQYSRVNLWLIFYFI